MTGDALGAIDLLPRSFFAEDDAFAWQKSGEDQRPDKEMPSCRETRTSGSREYEREVTFERL